MMTSSDTMLSLVFWCAERQETWQRDWTIRDVGDRDPDCMSALDFVFDQPPVWVREVVRSEYANGEPLLVVAAVDPNYWPRVIDVLFGGEYQGTLAI